MMANNSAISRRITLYAFLLSMLVSLQPGLLAQETDGDEAKEKPKESSRAALLVYHFNTARCHLAKNQSTHNGEEQRNGMTGFGPLNG